MTAKIIVTVTGLALVIFVNWYFFLSKKKKT
jgi:plastocyanin domain-containing protein